ncbi:MAG: phage tail protein [Actinomycetales bacterium]|nr:phage tail protein [Actinomycetales bacterium]
MSPVVSDDPYLNRDFLVQIMGITDDGSAGLQASFAEVTGLGARITPVEYRAGGDLSVRKLPGRATYPNVTFTRGINGNLAFWEWMKSALSGQVVRSDISVDLLNDVAEPVLSFRLRRAWPVRFEGPRLNATGNDVAVEVLEICHERLELA